MTVMDPPFQIGARQGCGGRYSAHPDWILCAPGRMRTTRRNQFVLDFGRAEAPLGQGRALWG